ncbi:gamma-glutamyl-gamma-aminobutyrate hydrolase family protein [Rhodococcus rhodochrous]|uniref:gamma-glutamyl-gamma-aminobutyrate hydrolase family protein n=1 Tax=Rhodococcus rhodochrous TaxID=1829 RepID=UPI0027E0A553|nr:gamma-glutamyl-gamma-aminobutyrate hydrolase family protein [Rhodococcus rhodochrous]MCB8913085.1 gamma-glutamyl-gamma-aminobutyrate hydrolase family protein [Rhodococcus rhodochrous]
MRPLIGISGRRWQGTRVDMEARYKKKQFDVHVSDFATKVAAAGGLPVQLPYESTGRDLIDRLDGLLISGGQDVDPVRWGGDPVDACDIDPLRDEYEIALIRDALDAGIPMLGICRGMQILNVALGGTLVPDLPTQELHHQQPGQPVEEETHTLQFLTGSTMFNIYGRTANVNSLHHQAVDTVGTGLTVTGWAPDGVVEAIEYGDEPVVGVQWHPEWRHKDAIFDWFIDQAAADLGGRRGVA